MYDIYKAFERAKDELLKHLRAPRVNHPFSLLPDKSPNCAPVTGNLLLSDKVAESTRC